MQFSYLKTAFGYKWRDLFRDGMADQKRLVDAKRIFDVGAFTGQVTKKYRKLFPEARIYSFEPCRESFNKLELVTDKKIFPYLLAVSDRSGLVDYHVNNNHATNSLLESTKDIGQWSDNKESITRVEERKVHSTTIDKFCSEWHVSTIDILKMDIQGGESRALDGAFHMLVNHCIKVIYTELLFVPLYEGQAWYYNITNHLSVMGYTLFGLYNFAIDKSGKLKWCDGLFCSEKVLKEYYAK